MAPTIAGQIGFRRNNHASNHFQLDPLDETRGDGSQIVGHDFQNHRHEDACFRSEEIDDFIFSRRQRILHVAFVAADIDVRGHAPRRFAEQRPNVVDDFVDETAFVFDSFREDESGEVHAPREIVRFIAGAVAVADEFHELAGGQLRNRGGQDFLRLLENGGDNRAFFLHR